MMQQVREIDGVAGVHVMAYRQEELVSEIVHESGVLAGRRPWRRELSPDTARVAARLNTLLAEAPVEALPEPVE
jgi:hypothetical protein